MSEKNLSPETRKFIAEELSKVLPLGEKRRTRLIENEDGEIEVVSDL